MRRINILDVSPNAHLDTLHKKKGSIYGVDGMFITNINERPFKNSNWVQLFFIHNSHSVSYLHGALPQNKNYMKKNGYRYSILLKTVNTSRPNGQPIMSHIQRFRTRNGMAAMWVDKNFGFTIPNILTNLLCN